MNLIKARSKPGSPELVWAMVELTGEEFAGLFPSMSPFVGKGGLVLQTKFKVVCKPERELGE